MAMRARNCFLIGGLLMILTAPGALMVAPEHFIGPIYGMFGAVFLVGAVLAHFDRRWFYQDLEYLPSGRVLQREIEYQICGCF